MSTNENSIPSVAPSPSVENSETCSGLIVQVRIKVGCRWAEGRARMERIHYSTVNPRVDNAWLSATSRLNDNNLQHRFSFLYIKYPQ